ncbi:MAG: protein kinase [Planctomycetes bacterium]|nr:protein kinase [Planctomycetota bacterium]
MLARRMREHRDLQKALAGEEPELPGALGDDRGAASPAARGAQAFQEAVALGDYRLLRPLGRGGMGVVYEAWQVSVDRRVAIKILPAGIAADPKMVERFEREAKAAAKLQHPNIVSVFGLGSEGGTPYYAMELVEGETLAQMLRRLQAARRIDLQYCIDIASAFAGVAEGLQHAHERGVIHRDIKPSNLILDKHGRVRILDFGLAHFEGQESLTLSGELLGTPVYMSPEQASARKAAVDHRTDVYSLGATLYEVLARRPPFQGRDHHETLSLIANREPQPLRRLNPHIPKDLETIVFKCLRKDPRDRYRTAEALAQDLHRFAGGRPIEARPQPAWERLARSAWRLRGRLAVGALVLLLLLAAAHIVRERQRWAHLENQEKLRDAIMQLHQGQSPFPSSLDLDSYKALLFPSEIEKAVEKLGELAKAAPDLAVARYHRARGLLFLQRKEEAFAELARALERDPGMVPARILRATLLEQRGDRTGSEGELRRARESGAGPRAEAWIEAHLAEREARWKDAAAAYGRLVETQDNRPGADDEGFAIEARLGRGIARLRGREYGAALEDFARAEERWPWSTAPPLLRAMAYHLRGSKEDKKDAERAFQEFFLRFGVDRRQEDNAALAVILSHLQVNDVSGAERWLEKLGDPSLRDAVTAKLPAHPAKRVGPVERIPIPASWRSKLEIVRAGVAKEAGNNEEALAAFKRAIALDPREPLAHVGKGWALRSLGKLEDARRAQEQALEIQPDLYLGHQELAFVLLQQGEHDRAMEHALKAVRLAPERCEAQNVYGNVLLKRGLVEDAIVAISKAVQLDPNNRYAHRDLGRALAEKGRWADALSQYHRALELGRDLWEDVHREIALLVHRAWGEKSLGEPLGRLRAMLEPGLELDKAHPLLLNTLALAWAHGEGAGDLEKASRFARAATAREERIDPRVLATLGRILCLQGERAEGARLIEEARRLLDAPGFAQALDDCGQ